MPTLRTCIALCLALLVAACGGDAPDEQRYAAKMRLMQSGKMLLTQPQKRSGGVASGGSAELVSRNLISNSGFENGDGPWVATENVIVTNSVAHSGARVAWLGGYNHADDSLYQDVEIPADALSVVLQFSYGILTEEAANEVAVDGLFLDVVDADTGHVYGRVATLTNQKAADSWQQSPDIDIALVKGRKIRLRFSATTDATLSTSFFVDDVTLLVTTKPTVAETLTASGKRADYTISGSMESGLRLVPNNGASSSNLANVSRVIFSDAVLSFELEGNAGQVFRLYQAAFGRQPDTTGIGFWIDVVDRKLVSMEQAAQEFVSSPEFSAKYGKLSDADFVKQLYLNVLHRTPDAGGLAFWLEAFNKKVTRAQVLVSFSESAENQTQVLPLVQSGIAFLPPSMVPAAPTCTAPKVLQNNLCVTPVPTCTAPQVLQNNVCVTPVPTCTAPQVLQNNVCVTPVPTCTPPKVLQNNVCVTPAPTCIAPQVLQNNVCVTPPPVCKAPQVLQNNVCVTPVPTCTANQALENNVCVSTCPANKQYKNALCFERPYIFGTTPYKGATNVSTNASKLLQIAFWGMTGSETDVSKYITLSPAVQVGGDTWNTGEAGRSLTLYKIADWRLQLKPSTVYTVTVSADASNANGISMGKPYSWTFTTAATCEVGVAKDGVCVAPTCPAGYSLAYNWVCVPPPVVCKPGQVRIEITNSCYTPPPITPAPSNPGSTPTPTPKPPSTSLPPVPTNPGNPNTPTTPTAPAVQHWAALAIDYNHGNRWGYAYDYSTLSQATQRALSECGSGCSVVMTYAGQCGAYAVDRNRDSSAYGWSHASTASAAQTRALSECRTRGGAGASCVVRVWACN